MKFILGLKLGMAQVFDEKGNVIPVTVIEAGPCQVTQTKTKEKDGYIAVQVGFIKKTRKIKKPEKGKEYRYIREFKIVKEDKSLSSPSPAKAGSVGDEPDGSSSPSPLLRKGSVIDVSIFQKGEKVKISGISKGKGFAGVVKRWGFAGRSTSHGTKHEVRTPGSVGASFPERVIKGKKMPGRMGGARVTVKNLEVVKVDPENNLLTVKGAVTGAKGTLLEICSGS